MTLYKGRTFTMPVQGSQIPHLFFALNKPDTKGHVAIVNITSCNNDGSDDKTLVLTNDDHPYIDGKSFVFYYKATITHTKDLIRAYNHFINSQTHEDASDKLMFNILCGIFNSDFTPPKVEGYVDNFFDKSECP